jgi:N-acyl-D-amino-acid deacylase
MTYDLIIRNGILIDGSGAPRYPADIGIIGDRIARMVAELERAAEGG